MLAQGDCSLQQAITFLFYRYGKAENKTLSD